jgi:hypothetical protein
VRDLVIGLSVMHSHTSGQCPAFDYGAFWGHSLATGIACQELAHFAQISSEELFTIGLLARVGELAMASLYPDEYAVVLLGRKRPRRTSARPSNVNASTWITVSWAPPCSPSGECPTC